MHEQHELLPTWQEHHEQPVSRCLLCPYMAGASWATREQIFAKSLHDRSIMSQQWADVCYSMSLHGRSILSNQRADVCFVTTWQEHHEQPVSRCLLCPYMAGASWATSEQSASPRTSLSLYSILSSFSWYSSPSSPDAWSIQFIIFKTNGGCVADC